MPRPEKRKRVISKILTVFKVDTSLIANDDAQNFPSCKITVFISSMLYNIFCFLNKATFVLTGFQIA